ncbi:hypothetical protein GCM10023186_31300 [Hymenobacter koreensis]|uniref:L,D-TPase catalytic domain-containing protein n=1 Tax=Hymenobacter koreensis TaxID=1084523 RepID=A0ABP8J7V7_9BACT
MRTDTVRARRLKPLVAVNLERLRWEPQADSVYLVVNIPAYVLQIVRGPRIVRTHRVVVGGKATPTPEFYSRLTYFQTSPEWRVPRSIAVNEILPRLRRNSGYLASNNYNLYDHQGKLVKAQAVNWTAITPENFPYQIRQTACCDNALGNVVFRFPNPHDIYLHDTPAREFFERPNRALSHGCIRLQNPLQLGSFLLRRDANQDATPRIKRMWDSVYSGETVIFSLRRPLPIVIRYLTCEADGPTLRTHADVYGRDAALLKAFYQISAEPLLTNADH